MGCISFATSALDLPSVINRMIERSLDGSDSIACDIALKPSYLPFVPARAARRQFLF